MLPLVEKPAQILDGDFDNQYGEQGKGKDTPFHQLIYQIVVVEKPEADYPPLYCALHTVICPKEDPVAFQLRVF